MKRKHNFRWRHCGACCHEAGRVVVVASTGDVSAAICERADKAERRLEIVTKRYTHQQKDLISLREALDSKGAHIDALLDQIKLDFSRINFLIARFLSQRSLLVRARQCGLDCGVVGLADEIDAELVHKPFQD